MIPLYGFVEGDTLGLLILADEDGTVAELVQLMVRSSGVRVAWAWDRPARLVYRGRVLDPKNSVHGSGITPLDRVDVVGGD